MLLQIKPIEVILSQSFVVEVGAFFSNGDDEAAKLEEERKSLMESWALAEEQLIGRLRPSKNMDVRPVSRAGGGHRPTAVIPSRPGFIKTFAMAPIKIILSYYGVLNVQVR